MQPPLVVTILGADRPGIVDRLAATVAAHEGNWEESRMARLAGMFAGILEIRVPENRIDDLSAALRALSRDGLDIVVRRAPQHAERDEVRRLELHLFGSDQPGIVREVSHVLADHGLNIEELATETVSAPMSGSAMFKATAALTAPTHVSLDEVQDALERIADDLVVEISLEVASEPHEHGRS